MLHALPIIDNTQPSIDLDTEARLLMQEWIDMMGSPARPYYQRRLHQWLSMGFEPGLLRSAMNDTMCAPSPAWRYLEAIIMRCGADKCYTEYGYINRRRPRGD